jgi:hypothetical protein
MLDSIIHRWNNLKGFSVEPAGYSSERRWHKTIIDLDPEPTFSLYSHEKARNPPDSIEGLQFPDQVGTRRVGVSFKIWERRDTGKEYSKEG